MGGGGIVGDVAGAFTGGLVGNDVYGIWGRDGGGGGGGGYGGYSTPPWQPPPGGQWYMSGAPGFSASPSMFGGYQQPATGPFAGLQSQGWGPSNFQAPGRLSDYTPSGGWTPEHMMQLHPWMSAERAANDYRYAGSGIGPRDPLMWHGDLGPRNDNWGYGNTTTALQRLGFMDNPQSWNYAGGDSGVWEPPSPPQQQQQQQQRPLGGKGTSLGGKGGGLYSQLGEGLGNQVRGGKGRGGQYQPEQPSPSYQAPAPAPAPPATPQTPASDFQPSPWMQGARAEAPPQYAEKMPIQGLNEGTQSGWGNIARRNYYGR